MIDAPPQVDAEGVPQTQLAHAVSTVGAGTVATYTVPAGKQSRLRSFGWVVNAGTPPTIQLQVIRSATTNVLFSAAAGPAQNLDVPLIAGDQVRLQCTVGGAGSNVDAFLGIDEENVSARVTISFIEPAVLDSGLNVYPGGPPLILTGEDVGQAFKEAIHAIASSGNPSITVLDLLEEDCACNPSTMRVIHDPTPRRKGVSING